MNTNIKSTIDLSEMLTAAQMLDKEFEVVEFCSLDEHTDLSDEYSDPFFIVAQNEADGGCPICFSSTSSL